MESVKIENGNKLRFIEKTEDQYNCGHHQFKQHIYNLITKTTCIECGAEVIYGDRV